VQSSGCPLSSCDIRMTQQKNAHYHVSEPFSLPSGEVVWVLRRRIDKSRVGDAAYIGCQLQVRLGVGLGSGHVPNSKTFL
jgi:hypothetical protein